ncbi:glycosyl hydrolase family 61-domain-containing protein [Cantharellus anzutake]|uniref:glycosyl hydrolase family 61-domain-containing protein n=1 Tax=Cantharellus anzutake TaxID=1750568 RepID=UPI001907468A|nr:glycosyl hydrolase family 61-domain-containing protein [Cantharellus anzutake]KAF8330766.1 glycosyl hydrolase family 61-domain-containing protein [Cantharellus anzutake]
MMIIKPSTALLHTIFSFFYITLVSAHGFTQNVTIAGKVWYGWDPFNDPYQNPLPQGIVRKPRDDGPIQDINDPALACNVYGIQPADLVADANAGDLVTFQMNRWPSDHLGPLTGWMANCGGDCKSFDPTKGNVWFKVSEDGLTNGQWASSKLISQGDKWSITIPPTIKAGQYLMRFELLALHSAGQPQFYPFCAQLDIKGTGSSVPGPGDLTSIPGVYNNAGQAIYGDIWNNPTSWPIAGPRPVAFAGGPGNPNDGGGNATTTTTPATSTGDAGKPKPTSTTGANPGMNTRRCQAKKRKNVYLKRAALARAQGSHAKIRRSKELLKLWLVFFFVSIIPCGC